MNRWMASRWELASFLLVVLLGSGAGQFPFDCPQLPPLQHPAKTVYELRPQDIKVIMALGDSVTAGFGIMGRHGDFWDDVQEYRGLSFAIGGDADAQTIATFLRHYTPDIVGASLGHHKGEPCYGIFCPKFPDVYEPLQDVFNAAQSGAMITDIVKHEFSYLIEQLKKNPKVDMDNDWKLLNIFIGANDLCIQCLGIFPSLSPDEWEYHMNEILSEVYQQIPKVFVNLILIGNVSEIYILSLQNEHCMDIHRMFPIECICAFWSGEEGDKRRLQLASMAEQYNQRTKKVAAEWAAKKLPEFAAVVQPFLSNARADNFTVAFLSDLDCFHPSLVGHQHVAKALWNNMLTPAAHKKTYFDWKEPFVCPTNTTLLYTY